MDRCSVMRSQRERRYAIEQDTIRSNAPKKLNSTKVSPRAEARTNEAAESLLPGKNLTSTSKILIIYVCNFTY